MRTICVVILVLINSWKGNTQIFPNLQGEELVDALQEQYRPHQWLSESQVRDTLYARIFIYQDSVRCIYSNLARYLPDSVDPSQYLFGSGNEVGSINLEHGWPQSKGAGEGMLGMTDMHHLYPSRVEINSDRADFPFAEIADEDVQKWYLLDETQGTIPDENIDAFSEFTPGYFEVRESVKGDIARAMFYFWTIYRDDAELADPFFFDLQKQTLCEWHYQDPADEMEMIRNERIFGYQGTANPFILDCTLAERAYCIDADNCEITSVPKSTKSNPYLEFDESSRSFKVQSEDLTRWHILVFNLAGQICLKTEIHSEEWAEKLNLPTGMYLILAYNSASSIVSKITIHRY